MTAKALDFGFIVLASPTPAFAQHQGVVGHGAAVLIDLHRQGLYHRAVVVVHDPTIAIRSSLRMGHHRLDADGIGSPAPTAGNGGRFSAKAVELRRGGRPVGKVVAMQGLTGELRINVPAHKANRAPEQTPCRR